MSRLPVAKWSKWWHAVAACFPIVLSIWWLFVADAKIASYYLTHEPASPHAQALWFAAVVLELTCACALWSMRWRRTGIHISSALVIAFVTVDIAQGRRGCGCAGLLLESAVEVRIAIFIAAIIQLIAAISHCRGIRQRGC
jgi:membrane protease YdiL (CAAX protease family)